MKNWTVTVHYPYHPLTGQKLRVWRTMKHGNTELLYCESEGNRIVTVPKWMTDYARCNALSEGEPYVEISALLALKDFLDKHLAGCRYGDSKKSQLEMEETGEQQIQKGDVSATRSPGSKRAGDEPAGVEHARPDYRSCGAGHRTREASKRRGGDTE
jgi:hypothetical protein